MTPSDTTPIPLSRALKLKNRVVHRLSELDQLITEYNSTREGNQEFDVRDLYRKRMVLATELVQLKVAINAVNQPVQHLIYELAECKAAIAMLRKVNTTHGKVAEGYSGVQVEYVAQFRKPDINREVRRIEAEVDRLQDELDQSNHQTRVAIKTALLAAVEVESGTPQ